MLIIKSRRNGYAPSQTGSGNTFALSAPAKVSAAVYKPDDTLVRTLFGGVDYPAGTHPRPEWDGTDDAGTELPDGTYSIRATSNNIEAEWGIVGNNSTQQTGSTVHHSANAMTSMCFAGNYAYFAVGYAEGNPSHFKFHVSDPRSKLVSVPGSGATVVFCCTDGVRVYYAGLSTSPDQYIFATYTADDSFVTFAAGSPGDSHWGQTYASVIDKTTSAVIDSTGGAEYSFGGMTVQVAGNYLLVSYVDINQIRVLNKVTGALVRNISTFNKPRALTVDRGNDNALWFASSTSTVSRHTINSDGTLSAASLTLSGLVNPLATDVSPDGATIAVAEGYPKYQVRFFNTSTGDEGTPLGQLGGIAVNNFVEDDRFLFRSSNSPYKADSTFLQYQPDGTLWVGDQGNCRYQHFTASRVFIDNIQFAGTSYSAAADRNNPSRIFNNWLEYQVDHSKPLLATNGSWRLYRNWSYNVPHQFDNIFQRMRGVTTLPSGKTICLAHHTYPPEQGNLHRWQIVELPATGGLIFTGVEPTFTNGDQFDMAFTLNADGSLFRLTTPRVGEVGQWLRYPLTDQVNLVWGQPEVLATTPVIAENGPINEGGDHENQVTASGLVIAYSPAIQPGYHLGAVKPGDNKYLWQASLANTTGYRGAFPDDGTFEIGNNVLNGGNFATVVDDVIVSGYHGEFWQASQTNFWNLFWKNGQFLFQFGIDGNTAKNMGEASAGIAGNSLGGTMFKHNNGDLGLVSNDESAHAAAQCWRIKGIDTIQEHRMPFVKSGIPVAGAKNYTDLMAGIGGNGPLANNTAGWSFTPALIAGEWSITKRYATYKKDENDLLIDSTGSSVLTPRTLQRDLGTRNLTTWSLRGKLSFLQAFVPQVDNIEILDGVGRVIVQIHRNDPNPVVLLQVNGQTLATGDISNSIITLQPLSIAVSGSSITVGYAGFTPVVTTKLDTLADITNPKTFRAQMFTSDFRTHTINVANLKFYPQ